MFLEREQVIIKAWICFRCWNVHFGNVFEIFSSKIQGINAISYRFLNS